MNFKGVFIGIDWYKFGYIPWLSCAKNDAVAMHALFSDTLGGDTKLLVDDQATRGEIEKTIQELTQCNENDVVVIYFSGHGSETHELVAFDTDKNDLTNTTIPLETLTEWLSQIPAKRVLCILDCCFSGHAGAKVFQTGLQAKGLKTTEEFIKQLSGDNRLIFTACLGTEEAWENQRLGHGFLTYYLIEALLSSEEVRQSGKISVYKLFDYVTKKVTDAASAIGKTQTPTLTGRVEGDLTWPIFQTGPLYKAAFPDLVVQDITPDIDSLSAYGFSQDLLDAWAGKVKQLNHLQLDAINDFGLLRGEHLVVSAPTSSGKTMIGELAALHGTRYGKRTFFLLPMKALVNDKYASFKNIYGKFGLKTIRATGEHSDDVPALMRGQYNICLMTYEKFAALSLSSPHIVEQVGIIVIDEVQMVADASRGANLEFLITLLKMRRLQSIEPQLIALSAVIGDTNGFERWLGAKLLRRDMRPVPLDEGIITGNGTFRYIEEKAVEKQTANLITPVFRKGTNQDIVIPLVQKLVAEGKQVIVFRETKAKATACALYLARDLGLSSAQEIINLIPKTDPSRSSNDLVSALSGGIAFHIADLNPDERQIIEENFRAPNTKLRVIVATTTLAMGVNTPADAVVIVGLEHPGNEAYSIAEYKNMVGRAGRLGYTPKGYSYLVAMSSHDEQRYWSRYILGHPESFESRFFDAKTDPRSLILRVLTASQRYSMRGMSTEDISLFLEQSFGSFQQRQKIPSWQWDRGQIGIFITQLRGHDLIQDKGNGVYFLTQLGWVAGKSGVEVESIMRIIDAVKPLQPNEITDPTLIAISQLTVELDNVLFPINRRSTQAEPQAWQRELQGQQIPRHVQNQFYHNVRDQVDATLRVKKTVACLSWITDTPLAQIETAMTQFSGALNTAAGAIRSVASRTCDVLAVVGDIAQLLHPDLEIGDRVKRLTIRLEIGIPARALFIGEYTGSALARPDYLRLTAAGLSDWGAIEKAGDEQLLDCVDGSVIKLAAIRKAAVDRRVTNNDNDLLAPLLPVYEA